jgi:hypothetical protein
MRSRRRGGCRNVWARPSVAGAYAEGIDVVTDFKAYEARRMAEAEAIKEAAEVDKILEAEAEAEFKKYEAKKRRRRNG